MAWRDVGLRILDCIVWNDEYRFEMDGCEVYSLGQGGLMLWMFI